MDIVLSESMAMVVSHEVARASAEDARAECYLEEVN
jgi:hypothetical protein